MAFLKWLIRLILRILDEVNVIRTKLITFKGLNDNLDPTIIGDDELQTACDCRINKDNSLSKRTGYYKAMSGETNPILDIDQVSLNGSLYTLYGTKSDIKLKSGTSQVGCVSGLRGVRDGQFMNFNDKSFFANGVDEIKKMNLVSAYSVFAMPFVAGNNNLYKYDSSLNESLSVAAYYIFAVAAINNLVYTWDSGTLFIYDNNMVLLSTVTLSNGGASSESNMYINKSFIAIKNDPAYESNLFYKYGLDGSYIAGINPSDGAGPRPGERIAVNDSYIYEYFRQGQTVKKYDFSGTLIATYSTTFKIQCLDCENNNIYIYDYVSSGSHSIYKCDLAMNVLASNTVASSYVGTHTATDGWFNAGYFYLISGQYICLFNGNLTFLQEKDVGYTVYKAVVSPFDFTEWQDLCSPKRPIQFETSSSGAITGTPVMSYRYTGYNPISLLETSGGAISSQQTSTGKKNEVFFDFTLSTQWNKAKVDAIGVTHFNLYRKNGTADFKQVDSVPVYFELENNVGLMTLLNGALNNSAVTVTVDSTDGFSDTGTLFIGAEQITYTAITATTFTGCVRGANGTTAVSHSDNDPVSDAENPQSLTVADVKGLVFSENFYILVDDEIMEVYDVVDNVFSVTRGAKGTSIGRHASVTSVVYYFSYFDNIPTASLGAVCPIRNDYVDNCKYMTSFKGRFVMANSAEFPSRVYYSGFNAKTLAVDEDIIKETYYYDINPNDGDEIRGLCVYQDVLYIFKSRSTWTITGDLDATIASSQVSKFHDQIGCESNAAIVNVNNALFWPSRQGWIMMEGTNIRNLSEGKIPSWWNQINWDASKNMSSLYYAPKQELWLSAPWGSSTTNNRVVVMSFQLSDFKTDNVFWVWKRSISCLKNIQYDGTQQTVIENAYYPTSGDYTGGINEEDETASDNGTAIVMDVKTKNHNIIYDNYKKFKRLIIDYKGQGTSYDFMYDVEVDNTAVCRDVVVSTGSSSIRDHEKITLLINNASTTLNGNHDNLAVTVTVTSTLGFDDAGQILVDSEKINYTAKTLTAFTGCTRGASGTTATSHTSGAVVTSTLNQFIGSTPQGSFMNIYFANDNVPDTVQIYGYYIDYKLLKVRS